MIALLMDLKAVVVDLQVALVALWAAMEALLVVLGPPDCAGGPPILEKSTKWIKMATTGIFRPVCGKDNYLIVNFSKHHYL